MEKQKITITIEDDDGSVRVVSDPSFAEIMQRMMGREPTACEDYALGALNRILELHKEAGKHQPKAPLALVDAPQTEETATSSN